MKPNNDLNGFMGVLNRWVEMNSELFDCTEGDSLMWYTEASCSSFLASAVWSSGNKKWCALKEFQHDKKIIDSKEKRKGRADLYIVTKDYGFLCEAKRRHFQLSDGSNYSKRISTFLKHAKNDINNSWDKEQYDHGLAISFGYLWSRKGNNLEATISEFCESAKRSDNVHAGAVWWLQDSVNMNGHYAIGMCILIEKAY